MFSVSDVVSVHQQYEQETQLNQCVGDGYLYSKNPLFRKVRNTVQRIGSVFVDAAEFTHYETCPHLAYSQILQQRMVPFIRNVGPLLEMKRLLPNLPIAKALEIRKNKVLHESAHLVAFSMIESNFALPCDPDRENQFVFRSLLSESFACACETMGRVFAVDGPHFWLYLQNSNEFGCEFQDFRLILNKVIDQFGKKSSFLFSILNFLSWNYFVPKMTEGGLQSILPWCGIKGRLKPSQIQVLLEFSSFHFRVRDRFRKEIAEFYFRSSGLNQSLAELLRFDFIHYIESHDSVQNSLQCLGDFFEEDWSA